MAKKITGYIKLQLPAGEATPAPPVGPALGQHGVNLMEFVKQFNAKSVGNVEKGEKVRIIDGPFANFEGDVDEIHEERSTIKVMVTVFGRSTPVELDFIQVEKR